MGVTNFPNGITSQGVPLIGEGIPATFGQVFFVNANSNEGASDGNRGLEMTRAFATVSQANTAITSGDHDVVVMTANSPHSISSEITLTKGRSHWVGLGGGSRYIGQRTSGRKRSCPALSRRSWTYSMETPGRLSQAVGTSFFGLSSGPIAKRRSRNTICQILRGCFPLYP